MGEFNLSLPGHRHRFSLGNYQLQLDPQIEAAILALQNQPPRPVLRNLFLHPNWAAMQQSQLDAMLRQPLPPARAPLVPRGRGPTTVRAAQVGDLMSAIWAIPVIRQTSERVLNDASSQLRRDWNRLSTGERVVLISYGTILMGSSMAAILSNQEGRDFVLNLIENRDVPIPGLSGLTVQVNRRGAGATYRNIAGSGVTVGGSGGVDQYGQAQYNVQVTLDLQQMLSGVGN